jgi:hypothetical protein
MTDYLSWTDLKTIIISLITGIIGGLIVLAIARYWSNHSIRSMRRRIEQTEAYKANVNNLAKSDRALLIYGFQGLFAILGLMNFLFVIQVIVSVIRAGRLDDWEIAQLLWIFPGLAAIGVAMVLHDVREYPESIKNIEKKITKLKNKLLWRS